MNDLLVAILCGLAGWRIASLLYQEDGPWGIFESFRKFTGIKPGPVTGFFPTLFTCIYCLSIWMSGLAYLVYVFLPEAAIILAAASLVIFVDKAARE